MSDHIETEELSAYLDGESGNNTLIEDHLQKCDTCSSRMVSMQSLVEVVQALPEPDVHVAFATRVRATIEERGNDTTPIRVRRWVMSVSGLAAVAIFVVAIFPQNGSAPTVQPTSAPATYAALDRVESILQQDEAELAARLESSLAREWVSGSIISAAYQVAELEHESSDSEILAAALSESEPAILLDSLWLGKTDSTTEIHRLTPRQSDLFKQILVVNAREVLLGDAAFEG
ncbi:MAG: hypothetical protein VCD00_10085 [Candidatus Hydrogenedentota bacterium]